ncbi:YbhN family protein [Rhizobium sp. SG2393]|uniref:lysylphosphatidylglycerol synthase transmembrane domain-containing protein n=1 Tax=Rhizobium sp. SG2393 TaxID=3276279 RepID=UPI00366AAAA4
MHLVKRAFWPVIGFLAIGFSLYGLYFELRDMSFHAFMDSLKAVSLKGWVLAIFSTLLAYAALAAYDHLALAHLGRRISLTFITVCSFTTYALSHTIGASVLSGAVVRYRAYQSKGLSPSEIGVLVAFCSFTFALGTLMLAAFVLIVSPDLVDRFADVIPKGLSRTTGVIILLVLLLYLAGSILRLPPLTTRWFSVQYPRPGIVLRQFVIAPIELIGAAGIIYFALPEAGNPGFLVILGVFLASFSAALLSHAPGGIGVLELVFIAALPEIPSADVLAALVIFRLLYLLIPFFIALAVVIGFERSRYVAEQKGLSRS